MSTIVTPTPELLAQYHRDGFLVLPDVLSPGEIATLRQGVENAFASHCPEADLYNMQAIWRPKMFEHGPAFEALVDHPGIAQLAEAVIGADYHLIANSALRTMPGKTITFWHVDEDVRLPLPAGVPLDPRITMPTYIFNAHYYLCDVDVELGPTQFIPGSHRAGRYPAPADLDASGNPTYEGRGVFHAVGKAGTCVIWNDQTWHQGGPNTSQNRTRWAVQTPFARRWIAQRFYPFVNYRFPEEILARANPRRRRIFGLHGIGAYG
jgi:ectoine hydroxylase-related dioxygenase (phytanoyl-CoA dioxygenase family)